MTKDEAITLKEGARVLYKPENVKGTVIMCNKYVIRIRWDSTHAPSCTSSYISTKDPKYLAKISEIN